MGNDRTPPRRRTTVAEAARILGISAEAVRGRIRRGTLPVEREDGTVYVLLEGIAEDRPTGDQPRTTGDRTDDRRQSDSPALISEMRDRIDSLERQLEQERQANAEHRRLLAAALERIPPQLEAPSAERDAPEATEEQQGRDQPRSEAPGPQEESVQRRPWWRRIIGGRTK